MFHHFEPFENCDKVLDFMRQQRPSGGGDRPEDVLSGFDCALNTLDWQSLLRVSILVADAPAHGYDPHSHDNHPSGLCPDQKVDLPTTLQRLQTEKHMDLLFCKSNPCTETMEQMMRSVFSKGGFGVVNLQKDSNLFKEAVLGTLSSSLATLLGECE